MANTTNNANAYALSWLKPSANAITGLIPNGLSIPKATHLAVACAPFLASQATASIRGLNFKKQQNINLKPET
jgi:hypothetical protein